MRKIQSHVLKSGLGAFLAVTQNIVAFQLEKKTTERFQKKMHYK